MKNQLLTLSIIQKGDRVLLGMKKQGFGKGKFFKPHVITVSVTEAAGMAAFELKYKSPAGGTPGCNNIHQLNCTINTIKEIRRAVYEIMRLIRQEKPYVHIDAR